MRTGRTIGEFEDQLIEIMQSEEQENKMTKMSKGMWDTVKQNNLCIIEQDRELGAEKFLRE